MPESFENRKEKSSAQKEDPKKTRKNLKNIASEKLNDFSNKLWDGVETFSIEMVKKIVEDATKENRTRIEIDMRLKTWPTKQMKELVKFNGRLDLTIRNSINKETAEELSKHKGVLYLRGVYGFRDEESAEELIKHEGKIVIPGLFTTIGATNPKIGEILSKHNMLYTGYNEGEEILYSVAWSQETLRYMLDDKLNSESPGLRRQVLEHKLTYLNSADAKKLVDHYQTKKETLDLSGLTSIDVETARELAKSNHTLELGGLTSINLEVAKELAKHCKSGHWLILNKALYLKLDEEVLRELEKYGKVSFG